MALGLVLVFVAAQVANPCGSGKNCSVNSLKTNAGTAAAPAVAFNADTDTGWWSSGANESSWAAGGARSFRLTGNGILYGTNNVGTLTMNDSAGVSLQYGSNALTCDNNNCKLNTGLGTGSAGTGTAFASFPTCTAGLLGRLLFDSTNTAWRYCDGAGSWLFVLNGSTSQSLVDVYSWNAQQGTGGEVVNTNWLGPYRTGNTGSTVRVAACNWQAAGTGGTTGVTLQIYNITDSVALCSLGSVACTTAARTPFTLASCNGTAVAANKTYVVRVSASDCTTQPTGTVCNIEGLRQP